MKRQYSLKEAQDSLDIGDHMDIDNQWLIDRIKTLESENQKLLQLILLTDDKVSHIEMNPLSLTQYNEFVRWQEELAEDL